MVGCMKQRQRPTPTGAAPSILSAPPRELGFAADLGDRIGAAVQEFVDRRQLAGAVVVVARRGALAHLEARGMADIGAGTQMHADTIFRIYSMTKAVGSVAVMMLCDEGRLQLDVPAAEYLPSLRGLPVAPDAAAGERTAVRAHRDITVRDLLCHTAGMPGPLVIDQVLQENGLPPVGRCSLQQIVDHLAQVQLLYQPGTEWRYSFAADVLGRLVEVVSGLPFDRYLAERIFQPLGMRDTAFFCPPEQAHRLAAMYGPDPGGGLRETDAPQGGTVTPFSFQEPPRFLSNGGGLVSTASDYLRFCLMLTGGGVLDGVRLLQPDTVAAMTRNQLPPELIPIRKQPQERYEGLGFGLGFSVRVRPSAFVPASQVGEYGWIGGASTEFWVSPASDLIVVTLAQYMRFSPLSRVVKGIVYAALEQE